MTSYSSLAPCCNAQYSKIAIWKLAEANSHDVSRNPAHSTLNSVCPRRTWCRIPSCTTTSCLVPLVSTKMPALSKISSLRLVNFRLESWPKGKMASLIASGEIRMRLEKLVGAQGHVWHCLTLQFHGWNPRSAIGTLCQTVTISSIQHCHVET